MLKIEAFPITNFSIWPWTTAPTAFLYATNCVNSLDFCIVTPRSMYAPSPCKPQADTERYPKEAQLASLGHQSDSRSPWQARPAGRQAGWPSGCKAGWLAGWSPGGLGPQALKSYDFPQELTHIYLWIYVHVYMTTPLLHNSLVVWLC